MKNLNRIICLVLVLSFAFSLSSCKSDYESFEAESGTSKANAKVSGYEDIECKTSKGTKFRYFSFDDKDNYVLSLSLPVEWTIDADDVGYSLSRDGEKIGSIKLGRTINMPTETVCYHEKNSSEGVAYEWSIISNGNTFTHRIVYDCKMGENNRSITLDVKYEDLDELALKKARFSSSIKKSRTDSGLGTINLSARPGEKPILILGNSFVGSSRVGAIFESMCEASSKNRYDVIWDSQGMATVSQNWSEYEEPMRNGSYAAVFMCGFYGSGDVIAFERFVDLCKASNTPIVIFPAHNESNGANAANSYSYAHYLNWKGELDTLISNGVDRWDLCVDDYYDHSLPLAGYVGAHMIYRTLFGEMPPILNEYDNGLYHSTVTQKLGDYVQTGCVSLIDGDVSIYKMN